MAMEYYASPSSPLSRIFPIFFGPRADVFGRIGNLFNDECYTGLPSVIPEASVNLAAKLLRENGIEPRPLMFEMTASEIVDSMKRFLCVFAWNIENPDFVTAECVNQILTVIRSSVDEKLTLAPVKAPVPACPGDVPPAQAIQEKAGGKVLPLKRCIDILREQLAIEVTSMNAVVEEALEALCDDSVRDALGYTGD